MKRRQNVASLGMACALALACNRGESAQRPSEKTLATAQESAQPAANGPRGVLPNDLCSLIPVGDVEAILGKLAGPPKGDRTSCTYPLPMDEETAKTRAAFQQMARDLDPKSAAANDTTMKSVAVIVTVDLRGDMTGERAGKIAGSMLANMFAGVLGKNAPPPDTTKREEPTRPAGWDKVSAFRGKSDFRGRLGHLIVSVDENSDLINAVAAEKKAELGARFRDRVTDLPFPYPFAGPASNEPPPKPDPCSLVTREEAEAVLGKLLAPPYRSHDGGPYANPNGWSCAYYTAGHHVLVLTPKWRNGKQLFQITQGLGTLVTSVAADPDREAADTLDGPWDNVMLGLDGTLAFLKGDQLLEVEYLTSSTDAAGAVRLARVALKRLASQASS